MSWNPVGPPRPRASIRCQLSCHTAGWQGERDQERDHSAQWHHSGSSALTTGSSLRSVTKIGDAPEFEPGMEVLQCSAPAENKGNLACFVEVLAPNLVDVGLVFADNGSGLGTAPRAHPCLCAHATGVGSCCACTSTAAASATRMAARGRRSEHCARSWAVLRRPRRCWGRL